MPDTDTRVLTSEEAALAYAAHGLAVFPIYEIGEDDACTCGGKKDCSPGKHPRTVGGYHDGTTNPEAIRAWWHMWPTAGIGVNLNKSGLVDVAPDSSEWLEEFKRRGMKTPARFRSAGGPGHAHFLFRRPVGCPRVRITRSGAYDILSDGYAIMPPTRGKEGRSYRWPGEMPNLNGTLPEAPDWAVSLLRERAEELAAKHLKGQQAASAPTSGEPPVTLSDHDAGVWRGDDPKRLPDGSIDRSASLLKVGRVLFNAGMTRAGVIAALRERDVTLGWEKYTARGDATIRYSEIVDELEREGRPPIVVISEDGGARAAERLKPTAIWPTPLGTAAWHGVTGQFIAMADPCSEADPAAVHLTFLAMFGNAVGRGPYIKLGTEIHRCNIFLGLVGASGSGRKGTSIGPGRYVVGAADGEWLSHRVANGLVSGEGVIYNVRDASTETIGTAKPWDGKTVKAPTLRDGGVTDKRLLCIETELGSLLTAMHRQGSTLSHVLRTAWDGQKLQSLSKNAPVTATGAHISVVGHITPDELRTALTSVDAANGFGNRFLWGMVRRSKILPRPAPFEGPAVDTLIQDIREALDHGAAVGQMQMDAETGDAYDAYYRGLPEDPPGLSGVMAVRMPAFVLRLSMIYALLDVTAVIRQPHFEAALEVARFCQDSARIIFGEMTGDPFADRIYEALRAEPLSKRQIIHDVFGRHVSAATIASALKALERAGLAYPTRTSTAGRPAEVWSAW